MHEKFIILITTEKLERELDSPLYQSSKFVQLTVLSITELIELPPFVVPSFRLFSASFVLLVRSIRSSIHIFFFFNRIEEIYLCSSKEKIDGLEKLKTIDKSTSDWNVSLRCQFKCCYWLLNGMWRKSTNESNQF